MHLANTFGSRRETKVKIEVTITNTHYDWILYTDAMLDAILDADPDAITRMELK